MARVSDGGASSTWKRRQGRDGGVWDHFVPANHEKKHDRPFEVSVNGVELVVYVTEGTKYVVPENTLIARYYVPENTLTKKVLHDADGRAALGSAIHESSAHCGKNAANTMEGRNAKDKQPRGDDDELERMSHEDKLLRKKNTLELYGCYVNSVDSDSCNESGNEYTQEEAKNEDNRIPIFVDDDEAKKRRRAAKRKKQEKKKQYSSSVLKIAKGFEEERRRDYDELNNVFKIARKKARALAASESERNNKGFSEITSKMIDSCDDVITHIDNVIAYYDNELSRNNPICIE